MESLPNIQYTVYNDKLKDKVRSGRDMVWMPLGLERSMFWLRLTDEHIWPRGYWLKHFNSRQVSLQLILEGCMHVTISGNEHIVPAGSAAIIPAGNSSLAAGKNNFCRKIYLIPSGIMFESAVHRLMFDRFSIIRDFDTPAFRSLYDELMDLAERKELESIPRYSGLSYELVMYTANLLRRSFIPPQLSDCLDFIRSHIAEDLSLDRISSAVHLNKTALKELFKIHLKKSPGRYITEARLNYAKILLEDSSYPIKEIAGLCGYESPFYFSNAFRKEFGISPRNYRCGNQRP